MARLDIDATSYPPSINTLLPSQFPLPVLGVVWVAIAPNFGIFDDFAPLIPHLLGVLVERAILTFDGQTHDLCLRLPKLKINIYNLRSKKLFWG
jgi:hypothetical protein